jgi:hypothetical protein
VTGPANAVLILLENVDADIHPRTGFHTVREPIARS